MDVNLGLFDIPIQLSMHQPDLIFLMTNIFMITVNKFA